MKKQSKKRTTKKLTTKKRGPTKRRNPDPGEKWTKQGAAFDKLLIEISEMMKTLGKIDRDIMPGGVTESKVHVKIQKVKEELNQLYNLVHMYRG